ncbi:SulP family inorganic anion transporter [Pedobacter sp.]|uniref:SulP family inorganic anion transporter n=1 Tax=Pedobacter sp. TaxID=1411316 RepID=UPI003C672933
MSGILQVTVGLFKLGKFIRLVPQPSIFGFVYGLAVIIFMSQLSQFKVEGTETLLSGYALYIMLGPVALTIAMVVVLPRLTKAVPSSLVAIIVVFAIVAGLSIQTKTVNDIASLLVVLRRFMFHRFPLT